MCLFRQGSFRLHSGEKSAFKIDCDALSEEEVRLLCALLKDILPDYSSVAGVPRGGLRIAAQMERWCDPGAGRILIVDDVYTTGGSISIYRFEHFAGVAPENVIGAVLFARRPVQHDWVTALFTMADGADC